jgi:hypothetical protein
MISNRASAATLFQAAFDAYCGVDAALSQIAADLPPEELAVCKRAVGQVMGTILFEITEPILQHHPELLPEAWRDADSTKA